MPEPGRAARVRVRVRLSSTSEPPRHNAAGVRSGRESVSQRRHREQPARCCSGRWWSRRVVRASCARFLAGVGFDGTLGSAVAMCGSDEPRRGGRRRGPRVRRPDSSRPPATRGRTPRGMPAAVDRRPPGRTTSPRAPTHLSPALTRRRLGQATDRRRAASGCGAAAERSAMRGPVATWRRSPWRPWRLRLPWPSATVAWRSCCDWRSGPWPRRRRCSAGGP